MASPEDLASITDFYDLLSIPSSSTESEIRRAYRQTSRLYHPDKVTPTPETLQKFHLLQSALAVLTDASEKAKYDASREAKERRKAENEALEGRRRKMKEELERREGAPVIVVDGANKRSWSERDLEIKRIAEENRRRREVAVERKWRDVRDAEIKATEARQGEEQQHPAGGGGGVDPMERSVKVRWVKEGDGLDIDDVVLLEMFPAGEVENVGLLKDKKRKVDGRDKKVVMGTALLVFRSLAAAKRAVAKGKTDELESVEWAASEKEKGTT